MTNTKTFSKLLGGSMAAATLAGGAMLAQAPAASASDWDRLAECESGGDWSIDTGNGYHGGLQFSQQSWEAVGGSGSPSNASKEEQIQRAEQLQSIQGWGAWPACSAQLGLSGSPSGGGGSSEPAPEQQETQQQAPQQQEQPQQQAPQEQPQQQAPQQQVEQAPQEQVQQQAPQQQSYSAAGEVSAEPNGDVEVGEETYTVESGDSLSSIADALDLDWQDLWGANADSVEDPNVIFVGDELKLPVVN